jgi:hypothetical protein
MRAVVEVEVTDHKVELDEAAPEVVVVVQGIILTLTGIIDNYQQVILVTANQAQAVVAVQAATMVDFHTEMAAKVALEL